MHFATINGAFGIGAFVLPLIEGEYRRMLPKNAEIISGQVIYPIEKQQVQLWYSYTDTTVQDERVFVIHENEGFFDFPNNAKSTILAFCHKFDASGFFIVMEHF